MLRNGCGKMSLAHRKLSIDPKKSAYAVAPKENNTSSPWPGRESPRTSSCASSFQCAVRYIKRVEAHCSTLAGISSCSKGTMFRPNQADRPALIQPKSCSKQPRWTTLAAHSSKVSLLKLLQVRRLRTLRRDPLAKDLQSTLSSIFARVVHVLSIVPKAGVDSLRADSNGTGPSGTAT